MIVGINAGEQGITPFPIEPKPVLVAGVKNR